MSLINSTNADFFYLSQNEYLGINDEFNEKVGHPKVVIAQSREVVGELILEGQ